MEDKHYSVKIEESRFLISKAEKLVALGLGNEDSELVVPAMLTIAVALEALLNDAIISFCFKIYPESDYRGIAESYLSMSLKGKLLVVVPLASNSKFILDKSSDVYHSLVNLIKVRNELAHTKSFISKITLKSVDSDGGGLIADGLEIDPEWYDKQFDRPLFHGGYEQASSCLEAIKLLSSLLMIKGENPRFSEYEFVREVKA